MQTERAWSFGEKDFRLLGPEEAREHVAIEGGRGAIWCPHSARVHPTKLARGLLGNKIKEHKLHNNPLIPLDMIVAGNAKKGDVIGVARIAGIMAAKRTHELIPLCHPLALTFVGVEIESVGRLPGLRVADGAQLAYHPSVASRALHELPVAYDA